MNDWFDDIDKILLSFVDTFNGTVDRSFWNSIFENRMTKIYGASGIQIVGEEQKLYGWLKKFFLFDSQNKWIGHYKQIDMKLLPSSQIQVPVELRYPEYDIEIPLNYLAGFTASLEVEGIYRPQTSIGFGKRQGEPVKNEELLKSLIQKWNG